MYFAIASLIITSALQAQSINLTAPVGSVSFGTSVTILTNGNYVVTDPNWRKGFAPNVGAVYLYDGQTNTLISTLTGSQINDQVGNGGVTALANGNYVVSSTFWGNGGTIKAGAVTWCNGQTGVYGVVSIANSLVGNSVNDYVGEGITALNNGNYVVRSNDWDNGNILDAGAVTWGNGNSGVNGAISSANSLIGTSAYDKVGYDGITALTNGNYLVVSTA